MGIRNSDKFYRRIFFEAADCDLKELKQKSLQFPEGFLIK